jgi:SAM-dependent methyltransferase
MKQAKQELPAWSLSDKNWAVVNISPRQIRRRQVRARLARSYLRGDGLEIGALHMPLPLPSAARVRYVDYKPTNELRAIYDGGYRFFSIAPVSIIDDGEVLSSVENGSIDFLIANHVIEHCENPIGTLTRWLDVLRPGGILFLAVPDKRYTFDRDRPLTSAEHILRDYHDGPAWSRDQPFEEYTRYVQRPADDALAARIAELKAADVRIHFHVWTAESFQQLLRRCIAELRLPSELVAHESVMNETIVILRKFARGRNSAQ